LFDIHALVGNDEGVFCALNLQQCTAWKQVKAKADRAEFKCDSEVRLLGIRLIQDKRYKLYLN